ncbi:MAG: hypothetical protein P1U87_20655 [Verrucomicrobiales bacterium]|nr:hypothetical protein [Verrucomicrobiales bacterium]
MNTTGYLILIAALLIVATLLLYARFVSRARENSLHHSPIEPLAPIKEQGILDEMEEAEAPLAEGEVLEIEDEATMINEIADPVVVETAEDLPEIIFEESVVVEAEEVLEEEPEPAAPVEQIAMRRHEPTGEDSEGAEEKNRKGEYLDELQEAAAGLAMLMRSSTVAKRSTPVVYAPDEEGVAEVEKQLEREEATSEQILMEVAEPVAAEPVEAEQEFQESTETASVVEEAVEARETDPVEEVAVADSESEVEVECEVSEERPAINVLELLGSDVCDQMEKIDSGLDALEELVNSIESSLSALSPLEWEADGELSSVEGEEISVAA